MHTQRVLVGELQLGQTLNHCVHDGKKSEFDLLLAMLSSDVCEQDQFLIENTDAITKADVTSLNQQFNIPTPQVLQTETLAQDEYSLQFGQCVSDEGILSARLQHCLRPDALHFKQSMRHNLPIDVYNNLSPSIAQGLTDHKHTLDPLTVTTDELIAAQQAYEAKLIAA